MKKGPVWWRSRRYQMAAMIFLGVASMVFQRSHMSFAVVCMVNHTAVDLQSGLLVDNVISNVNVTENSARQNNSSNSTRISGVDLYVEGDRNSWGSTTDNGSARQEEESISCRDVSENTLEDGSLVWGKQTQGLVVGAAYWTYCAFQLPGALVMERGLTPKWGMVSAMTGISLFNLLVPPAAFLSPYAVVALRMAAGACMVMFTLSFSSIWRDWSPPTERSRLLGICFSGIMFANSFVFPASGLLCRSGLAGGWPSIFYVFGGVGLLWSVATALLVYDSPSQHPWISEEERLYIASSIPYTHPTKKKPTPWRRVLTSPPLWALAIAGSCSNWGVFLSVTTTPTYMKEVLKFDIKANGFFSMLPYLGAWAIVYVSGVVSDFLLERKLLSVSKTRKAVFSSGQVVAAVCLVLLGYQDCTGAGVAVALMTISVSTVSTQLATLSVNVHDLVPGFVASCLAACNTLATIPGFMAPTIVAALTPDKTPEQWRIVFFCVAAIMMAGTLFYVIFGRGHPLEWAVPRTEVEVEEDLTDKASLPEGLLLDVKKDLAWTNHEIEILPPKKQLNGDHGGSPKATEKLMSSSA